MSATQIATIEDEAAEWLVRRDAGLTPEEQDRLTEWIAASPTHEQAWDRATAAWASFDSADDDLFEVMRTQAFAAGPVANDNWRTVLIAASGVAAVLLIGVLGWRELGVDVAPTTVQMIASAPGQRLVRRLADGTRVTLDNQTTLQTEFDAHARRVRLVRGQAYFEVAAAKGRPFYVQAGDRTVTDIGTRFAVRRDEAGAGVITVVLEQGLVSVAGAGETRGLRAGDRFRAAAGAPGVVDHVDPSQALAWRDGYLEFRNTPLREAIGEINRYGGRQISLADQSAGDLRISGRFPANDPRGFAEAVAALQPVDVAPTDAGITLRTRR
jgi:transmembrane sensor